MGSLSRCKGFISLVASERLQVFTVKECGSLTMPPFIQTPGKAGRIVKMVLFLARSVLISTLATVPGGGTSSIWCPKELRSDGLAFMVRMDFIRKLFLLSATFIFWVESGCSQCWLRFTWSMEGSLHTSLDLSNSVSRWVKSFVMFWRTSIGTVYTPSPSGHLMRSECSEDERDAHTKSFCELTLLDDEWTDLYNNIILPNCIWIKLLQFKRILIH